MNVFFFVLEGVLLIAVCVLVKLFGNKLKIHKYLKYAILGVIFGGLSILFSIFGCKTNLGNTFSFANTAIIVGGSLFGGPIGLIAGIISGVENLIFNQTIATKYAISIGLFSSGLLSLLLYYLTNENEKFRWYFILIGSGVLEVITLLSIFLTNINNLSLAYSIVNDIVLYSILINLLEVILCIIPILIINKKWYKIQRPLSIQSKVQITLGSTIVVGLLVVILASSLVLGNLSKESTKSTIAMSTSDIKINVDDDMQTDILANTKKAYQSLKMSVVTVLTPEEAKKEMTTVAAQTGFSNLTLANEDGSIKCTSDSIFDTLTNVSDLKIGTLQRGSDVTQITGFTYVEPKEANYKYVWKTYSSSGPLYLLGEIDLVGYKKLIKSSFERGIASRHLGEDGFIFVLDENKQIISSPVPLKQEEIDKCNFVMDDLSITVIDNKEYYSYATDFYGYKIIGLMNKASTDVSKNTAIYIASFTATILFFIIYLLIYLFLKKQIINPLHNVNQSLHKISNGELEEKADENSSKELKYLSGHINTTVDSLKEYMGKETKLIQQELAFATDIQHSALPSTFPPFPSHHEFDIYASMSTAKEVGGDFYDFYLVDDNHLCILIADVSGKGVPAALFMMQSKTILKSYIESKIPLNEAFDLANKKICESNKANMFVTIWCGILDLKTGDMQFVNAGHNSPLIKQKDEFVFLKSKRDLIFGAIDSINYNIQNVKLEKNAELFLYTDGINEAMSINNKLFGNDRMLECANNSKTNSSQEFCEKMMTSVKEFTKDAEQSDDITELHIKYFGLIK